MLLSCYVRFTGIALTAPFKNIQPAIMIRNSLSTNSTWNPQNDRVLSDLDPIQRRLLEENCILVDPNDKMIGSATKKECHLMSNIRKGMLHRAFSLFLFNKEGQLLLQQRSMKKITFPGYFTNTCCSHPLNNESEIEGKDAIGVKRAVIRKIEQELGVSPQQISVDDLQFITRILYQAPSDGMWGEYEVDYCFVAQKDVDLVVNSNEVMTCRYVDRSQLHQLLNDAVKQKGKVTPWFQLITKDLLWKWWDNLDNIDSVTDVNSIHKLM